MRPLANRERWLLAVLPAITLVGIHVVAWRGPLKDERAAIERQLAALGPSGHPEDARLLEKNTRVEQLVDERESVGKRLDARVAAWSRAADRAATVRRVAALLDHEQVALIESTSQIVGRAESTDASAKDPPPPLPAGLLKLAARMRGLGASDPALWRFHFTSGFRELANVLRGLAQLDAFVLPVQLRVNADPSTGVLSCNLWMWI